MTGGIPLGRIRGVRVTVDWSVLAIAALLTVGLAGSRLPDEAPGYADALYWIAGIVTAVAFLASVLAHEVSHAVVAGREGIEVEGITLWLFGGLAQLTGEPRTPGADLRVAASGPAVSVAVGVVAGAAALALDAAGGPALVVAMLGWLGGINLVLAAFNLIPAAPLDGGRILRAALWAWRKDRVWAATAAARAGRWFGVLLIAAGVAQFLGGVPGGLWTAFIGWFLLNAARAEEGATIVHARLAGVRVRDVMTPDPVTGPGWWTVDAFIDEVVLRHRCSAFPVEDFEGHLQGLVTLNRLRAVPADERARLRVLDVARPLSEVPTAKPDELLLDVLARATGGSDGRVLVVDDAGGVVGIVSPSDVTRALEVGALRSGAGGERDGIGRVD